MITMGSTGVAHSGPRRAEALALGYANPTLGITHRGPRRTEAPKSADGNQRYEHVGVSERGIGACVYVAGVLATEMEDEPDQEVARFPPARHLWSVPARTHGRTHACGHGAEVTICSGVYHDTRARRLHEYHTTHLRVGCSYR